MPVGTGGLVGLGVLVGVFGGWVGTVVSVGVMVTVTVTVPVAVIIAVGVWVGDGEISGRAIVALGAGSENPLSGETVGGVVDLT